MAYDDAIESIIRIRFEGIQDAPRLFEDAVNAADKFHGQVKALQQTQSAVQKQFNAAPPQQQPQLQSQLNTLAYQLDQATTARTQALEDVRTQQNWMQQYQDLGRRIQALEQTRTTTPPLPGPAENYSPGAIQAYTETQTELQHAQGKFQRARSDASKGKWSQEIDRLQAELAAIPEQLVRTAYAEPAAEIRRRMQALQQRTGQAATNAQFAQISQDVQQGRFLTPGEDPELTARRMAVMNPPNARQRFMSKVISNYKEMGGVNAGYAVMQLGEEGAQVAEQNLSGNRVSPEAQQRSMYGLIPGAAALLGAAGGWGPSMILGGIGSLAQGLFSAKSERDEKMRDAGEEIAASQGQLATAGRLYAHIIESAAKQAGTPAVELAQSLATLSHSVSNFNVTGAAGLQATLQSQLGDQYAATVGAQAKATTAPFSGFYRDTIAGNVSTAQAGRNYNAMADYYDAIGDRDTADKLRGPGGALATMQNNPEIAKLQADINRTREWQKQGMLRSGGLASFFVSNGRLEKGDDGKQVWRYETASDEAIRNTQARMDQLTAAGKAANATITAKNNSPAVLSAKQRGDALADTMQNARDTLAMRASEAATAASKAQQALDRGEGVAGMRRYAGAETSGLVSAQTALQSQQKALVDQIHSIGSNDPASGPLKAVLADVRKQLADATGQLQAVGIGIFRQGVSEDDASAQGRSSRLGIRGNTLLLSGTSAFDPRMSGNYGEQEALLRRRARYDENLADDPRNFLSPEERQARRTQASQEMFEAKYALPSAFEQMRLQQLQAESQVRLAKANVRVDAAQNSGTIGDIYDARNAQADETARTRNDLQSELNRMEQQGIGLLGQRLQLQAQIANLTVQENQQRQQALQDAYQMRSAELGGASTTGSALARRMTYAGGTTADSYGASSLSLTAQRANVENLRQAANDPNLPPSTQAQRFGAYQEAAAKLETDTVSQLGTYTESPKVRMQRIMLEGQRQRMAISPLVPGNDLSVTSQLVKLDKGDLTGIDARIGQVQTDPNLKPAERQNTLIALQSQKEDIQTRIMQESASVAERMFSNKIAQSINAPSFASRFLPSDSDVAAMAEKRGLGPYSARVFGSVSAQARRDSMALGLTAPDRNLTMFGTRPGDFVGDDVASRLKGFDGGSGAGSGASGDTGLHAAVAQLASILSGLQQSGINIHVTVTNSDTGRQTAQVVNTMVNSGDVTRAIMKGGGKPQGW